LVISGTINASAGNGYKNNRPVKYKKYTSKHCRAEKN